MPAISILATMAAVVLATLTAHWVVGTRPPRGGEPGSWLRPAWRPRSAARRAVALAALALALFLGVFQRLAVLGQDLNADFDSIATGQLFWLHAVLFGAVIVWFLAGSTSADKSRPWARARSYGLDFCRELGLRAPRPMLEVGLGLGVGLALWLAVLSFLVALAAVFAAAGADRLLPSEPPEMIVWIATLPWTIRLAVSLSAGIFEELFFRGLLQSRLGVLASTALFVLAHASYEQPFLLLGVSILSVCFALLAKWRQSILPAIAAHAAFDAVQLLFVIPLILDESQVAAPLLMTCRPNF